MNSNGHRRTRCRHRQQGRAARDRRRGRAREADRQGASSSRRWKTRSSAPPAPATAPRTTSAPSSTRSPATFACGASSRWSRRSRIISSRSTSKGAQKLQTGRRGRRLHRRSAAADRVRPHRRPGRQAGDLPEGPRRRARAPVRGIQGPRRRDHHRRRQARRVRPRRRRPRPRRGRHPPRPADPARDGPRRRPHPLADHDGRAAKPAARRSSSAARTPTS